MSENTEHKRFRFNKEVNSYTIIISAFIIGAFILGGFFINAKYSSKQDTSFIDPDGIFAGREFKQNEIVAGNPKSDIVVVEYSDTECPFCKQLHLDTMTKIEEKYKDSVSFVYRHFPLSFHTRAPKESEATLCAREQNQSFYKKFLDKIFNITPANNGMDPKELVTIATELGVDMTKWNNCMNASTYAAYVEADTQDGITAGADATPNIFVLIKQEDGSYRILTKIAGARDEKYVSKVLDQAIKIAK